MKIEQTITEGSCTIYRGVQFSILECVFIPKRVAAAREWFFASPMSSVEIQKERE